MEEKGSVVDRLYKRNAMRIETLEKQRKLKEEINVSNERLDYFSGIFKEKSDGIEAALDLVGTLKESETSSHFERVKRELCDLQNFIAASGFFLKEYNIRRSQAVVQNLQTRIAELEKIHLPKKKFGFRARSVLKKRNEKIEEDPTDAADGAARSAIRTEKWDSFSCGFSDRKNERLSPDGEDVDGKDVHLSRLDDCIVIIKGRPAAVHLDHVVNSIILCGPVRTSVFMSDCVDCKMAIACQQLRCHSSIDCQVYLHVTSKAIIEDSRGIQVAPYNLKYDGIEEDFATSPLDSKTNNWNVLDDFNWLAADVPSPNWRVLDENLRIADWNSFVDL